VNRSIRLLLRLAEREGGDARERYSALIAILRRHEQAILSYAPQAARIGEMEAELIDAKIAARAEGLLEELCLDRDAIAILESHVEGVLRPSQFGTMLEQASRALEEELAERKLTAQAKAILQRKYSMSEEQAHFHLRTMSRKSRRPLKELARELVEGRSSV
jgi:AmiR/NasT family two-component response regulator